MTTAAIEVAGLTKRFGETRAIDGIDLRVEEGEAFGFLGPNGAGKTTTIRAILGLLKPTSGRTSVHGHDSWSKPVEVHRLVGTLPGNFRYDDTLTGRQLLLHVARLRGASADDIAHGEQLADRLHADLTRPLGDLSRGNHQKIGLVQAMFHRPKVLLLDEPTSGLDPLMQDLFIDLVHEARDGGATVFLSSHNLTEVERTCRRVAIIRGGKVVTTDEVSELADRALRHVRVAFDDDVPRGELEQLPGATDLAIRGKQATFRIAGELDALTALLSRHHVHDLVVEHASLDELFRSFYENESEPAAVSATPGGEARTDA
ncbi:MAG: ABC transporter ATP-binding protein [Solirubrobacteraceae bacterium]|nr:ABC transporter ATP-binding protein [Solirubrobacteraceae bacterium]